MRQISANSSFLLVILLTNSVGHPVENAYIKSVRFGGRAGGRGRVEYLFSFALVNCMHQQSKGPKNVSVLHWGSNLHTKQGRKEAGVFGPGPNPSYTLIWSRFLVFANRVFQLGEWGGRGYLLCKEIGVAYELKGVVK